MFVWKICTSLVALIVFAVSPCKCQGGRGGMKMGGRGMGGGARGAGGGRGGRTASQATGPQNKGLPPGYANIRGEVMDMTNKLIQRITAAGSNYYSYDNQNGAAVFKRREMDSSRRFVMFPDVNFPAGDGHYVVLRRMPGVNIPGLIPQALYEAFQLSLGDSIHGYVTEFNSKQYIDSDVNTNGNRGLPVGITSVGGGSRGRRKR